MLDFKTHNRYQTSIKFDLNVLPEEDINAMYNSDQLMKQIVEVPLLAPYEKSTLYSNELPRFQSFQNQLQNQLRSQNNLQTQLQSLTIIQPRKILRQV